MLYGDPSNILAVSLLVLSWRQKGQPALNVRSSE
jgi:hypothetical protein